MDRIDDDFRIRLGRSRAEAAPRLGAIKGAVGRALSDRKGPSQRGASGGISGIRPHVRPRTKAAPTASSGASRRVVVKARIVPHAAGGAKTLKAHVSYLAREEKSAARELGASEAHDGLERQVDYLARDEGPMLGPNEFYDRSETGIDAKALTADWAQDLRHFRFIVSAEDGEALGDLKPFVRELMGDLERRLGTKLDWVAADHWDTDNPHSHILVRGVRDDGQALVIPRQVVSREIRERAQKIVTRVLGPRVMLGQELAQEQARRVQELAAPRLTPLDQEIISKSVHGLYAPSERRPEVLTRLQKLEAWDIAAKLPDGRWRLHPNLKDQLKVMGERAEVTAMLSRIKDLSLPEFDILPAGRDAPVQGRLVHVGQLDELSDRKVAVLEDGEGRLRYAGFERAADLAALEGAERGALIDFTPVMPKIRPADEAVARIADLSDGVYTKERHLLIEPHTDPALIEGNLRRLEAMRRANLTERLPDGRFVIAEDHLDRALAFETRQSAKSPLNVRAVSYWTLAEQERALGPTQLDRVLANEAEAPTGASRLARDFEAALQRRRLFLIEQGYLGSSEITLSRNAIQRLSMLELERTAKHLERETGMPVFHHHVSRIEGVYARRIDLAQGRYALIMNKDSGHLIEWRPALEQFAGRRVQGLARGRSIAWSLTKGRGVPLPPM